MNEAVRAGEPRGVAVATLTPMTAGLEPDFDRFAAHCRRMLDRGANLLAVLGTTGEANSLGVEEKLRLLDALGASDIPGETLLPGTGTCSIADTVILTRKALEVGAAGVVMLPPFYYKGVSDAGLHAAYEEVIQRVGDSRLRIYFYNFPFNSGVPISHGLIEGLLAAYPGTVAGIKDSSGDLDNMLAMCRRFPGFGVFAGSEQFLLPVLEAGGAGCISATANVTIGLCAQVLAAAEAGEDAGALQERLSAWRLAIQSQPLIPALKAIMARTDADPDWLALRPPLTVLDTPSGAALARALDDAGYALPA
ncbi:MAG: dihydrodipicolinate synthase family protein [Alphaproteobacteria bacterium]|nr:dihydrodipicolinate synthase family protein [Alphaproteobacteria bacterium]